MRAFISLSSPFEALQTIFPTCAGRREPHPQYLLPRLAESAAVFGWRGGDGLV